MRVDRMKVAGAVAKAAVALRVARTPEERGRAIALAVIAEKKAREAGRPDLIRRLAVARAAMEGSYGEG